MDIVESIITTIINHGEVTITDLENRAKQRGISLSQLYIALDKVGRDKRVTRTVRKGEVIYRKAVPRVSTAPTHLAWLRANYPRMTPETSADHPAFSELDYSWLFLKPKELLAYKAEAKGMPAYMSRMLRYRKYGHYS